jgi:hypothetical protein
VNARSTRARGTLAPDGKSRSIAIHFDVDIFKMIANEAVKNDLSFAEQVRIYVGRGMGVSFSMKERP